MSGRKLSTQLKIRSFSKVEKGERVREREREKVRERERERERVFLKYECVCEKRRLLLF